MSEPVTTKPPRRPQRVKLAWGVGLAAFVLYFICLAPTVTYTGDCGELIAASYRLGIAHPSGYPLYCLLGRVFASLVPFGEIAWRYNLLSALCSAISAGLMTATVHRLTVGTRPTASFFSNWPAIGAGLLFAGFRDIGTQAIIAEVTAVENLTEVGALYCAVVWHQQRDWRYAYGCALVFGMAILSHLTSMFMLPGLLAFVVIQHRDRFAGYWLRRGAVLVLLPALVYCLTAYLPLRARLFPEPAAPRAWHALDWTHPVDFPRWKAHVTGQQYRKLLTQPHAVTVAGHTLHVPWFTQPLRTVLARLRYQVLSLFFMYLWCAPLLVVGAWAAFQPRPPGKAANGDGIAENEGWSGGRWLGGMLLGTVLFNTGIEINYKVGDLSNFFFPTYVMLAVWMGLGLQVVFAKLDGWGRAKLAQKPGSMWHWRATTFAWMALLGTVACQWWFFHNTDSMRGVRSAYIAASERAEVAEQLLRTSGRVPTLFIMGDEGLWSFWYMRQIEGRALRVDTPWGPLRNEADDAGRLVDMVEAAQKTGPVALTKFDAKVDLKYPYEIPRWSSSGNLCVASRRALPPVAQVDRIVAGAKPGADGLVDGHFTRSRVAQAHGKTWRDGDMTDVSRAEFKPIERYGLASLNRGDLAAFEVRWAVTPAMQAALRSAPRDPEQKAARAGWIEVLMVRAGALKGTPPPNQPDMKDPTRDSNNIKVYRQSRRLVVPQGARAGQRFSTRVPLQIETAAGTVRCTVWTRIVTAPGDTTTPWQFSDCVFLTHR